MKKGKKKKNSDPFSVYRGLEAGNTTRGWLRHDRKPGTSV